MYTSIYPNSLAYANAGLAVIPLAVKGKNPITKNGLKDASKNPEQIKAWFDNYKRNNIGIVTGKVSNIWVIDEDIPGAWDELESKNSPIQKTPIAKTGRGGRHIYFVFPADVEIKNRTGFVAGIDVRGEGGYVVAPPSIHENGNGYEWLVSPMECDFAIAPDWLIALVVVSPSPKQQEAQQEAIKGGVKGEVNAPRSQSPTETPCESPSYVIEDAKDTILGRAKAFCDNTPTTDMDDELEYSHDKLLTLVCRLLEIFGSELSDENILSAISDWNNKCKPVKWTKKELQHKIDSARKKVNKEYSPPTQEYNDDDIEDKFPQLSDDAYHGIIGNLIRDIEPETEADPAGTLITLLVAIGNAIGTIPYFEVGAEHHKATLYLCLVGNTSSAKGQSFSVVKKLLKNQSLDVAYGLSSGEGLVERLSPEEKEEKEKIAFELIPPKKLLCFESEFIRPITAMKREGNTLSSLLRSAWDGQPLEVLCRGKNKLRVDNYQLSLICHVTAQELKKTITTIDTANGFANRFLWCLVRSIRDLPTGGNLAPIFEKYSQKFNDTIETAKAIGRMTRSIEAEKIWASEYARLKYAKSVAAERGRPQVVRLSMIYALMDGSSIIKEEHLKAALAVWDYCETSAAALFGTTNNPIVNLPYFDTLLNLVKSDPGITRDKLRKSISHKIEMTFPFNRALEALLNKGLIVLVKCMENRQVDRFYERAKSPKSPVPHDISDDIERAKSPKSPTSPVPHAKTEGEERATSPKSPVPHAKTEGEERAKSPKSPVPHDIATTTEMNIFMTDNSCEILQQGEIYWVTNDESLTPRLKAALLAKQSILKRMYKAPIEAPKNVAKNVAKDVAKGGVSVGGTSNDTHHLGFNRLLMSDDEFMEELKGM